MITTLTYCRLSLRFAWMNFKGNRRFALLFALGLSLGLSGLTLITGFQNALKRDSQRRSQLLAAADLIISGRRTFGAEELHKARSLLKGHLSDSTHRSRMFSMTARVLPNSMPQQSVADAQLAELHFIEDNFPLYGTLNTTEGRSLKQLWSSRASTPALAALSDDALQSLGFKIGELIKIGDVTFKVGAVLKDDDVLAGFTGTLAPRIYLPMAYRKQTGLIQKGSSVWNDYLYRLGDPQHLDELSEQLQQTFADEPAITVSTHRSSSAQSSRLLTLLSRYLALVGLVAFFLSCLGASFLFRSYLLRALPETATLITLGLPPYAALIPTLLYIILLCSLATLLSCALALTFAFILPKLMSYAALHDLGELQFSVDGAGILELWCMSFLGTALLLLPLLLKIARTSCHALFSSHHQQHLHPSSMQKLAYLPAFALFWLLVIRYCASLKVGSIFILSSLGAASALWFFSVLLHQIIRRIPIKDSSPLSLRLCWLSLKRQPFYGGASFMASSGSILLITLIPLLQHSISREIQRPESQPPDFFLLDIQREQREALTDILTDFDLLNSWKDAPFILATIKTINGEPFYDDTSSSSSSSPEKRRRGFRGGTRLTYRAQLSPSERITAGRFYQGSWNDESQKLPELSVTEEYARRRGMKLGDVLSFDIAGLEIQGRITSLRDVDWLSFEPNFMMQFQPGVLEDAPQSFIGVLGGLGQSHRRKALQERIVREMPNISLVDIRKVRDVVQSTVKSVSQAFMLMAFLNVVSGFLIFAFMMHYNLLCRLKNMALLSVLGLSVERIRKACVLEHAFLGLLASCCGALISLLLCSMLSVLIFSLESVHLTWSYPLIFISIGFFCTLALAELVSRRILKQPLWPLLSKRA